MHVPDGFLDAPTSIATGAATVVAIGLSLRGARRELDDKTAPLTGLVAAFIFAVQMLNFPVGAGTSGHLLGGALAAVLVGPWTAILCMTVVLLVQALFFADGGVTALGTNILLMGVVTVVVGWAVFKLLQKLLPKRPASVVPAAFAGAAVSVPVAALCFTGLYIVGGAVDIPLPALAGSMIGWHVLIGLGEAVITSLTIASVLAVRPDLVYGARPLLATRTLEIRRTSKTPEASTP
ncbi:energy-coupling factor ABC transporter permease [Flindersiella endophytica]